MPSPRALLGGTALVLSAFLLGRCTAGGGNEVATPTATTTATLLTTTSVFTILHTVKENETLAAIAATYNVTIEAIAIANNIGNTNIVIVGSQLKIPPPTPIATTTTTLKKKGK
jgi:LysM repeat protein